MLNEDEVAALESLIARMTDKQRSALEAWISGGYPFPSSAGKQWVPDRPLWEAVKEAQEYVVPPGEPWRTPEDRRPQLAERKEAGRSIDVATCEITWTYGEILDPYGVLDLPREHDCVGRLYFVRSPERDGWVSSYDLPEESAIALHQRIDREGIPETLHGLYELHEFYPHTSHQFLKKFSGVS